MEAGRNEGAKDLKGKKSDRRERENFRYKEREREQERKLYII